jgi:hypothetical protein
MNKVLRTAVLAALVLLPARPVLAADDKPDADAILARGIKALGGEARLEKYQAATWKAKGTMHRASGTIEYSGAWAMQAPDKYREEITGKADGMEVKHVRVVDGDHGWLRLNDGAATDLGPDALAETRRELHAQLLTRLVPLRDAAAFTLTATGPTKVGDTAAVGLEVAAKDGRKFRLYFDRDSGLLLASEALVKPGAADQEVKQEVLYDDYQDAGGVKHARKITIKRNGRTVLEQEVLEYKPLEKLDAREFARPS